MFSSPRTTTTSFLSVYSYFGFIPKEKPVEFSRTEFFRNEKQKKHTFMIDFDSTIALSFNKMAIVFQNLHLNQTIFLMIDSVRIGKNPNENAFLVPCKSFTLHQEEEI
jgi:hypothetical protein